MIIKVPKKCGEKARKELQKIGLLDREVQVEADKAWVYLGIVRRLTPKEVKTVGEFKYTQRKAKKRDIVPQSLASALKDVLSSEEQEELTTSFDIIGDIAILMVPDGLEPKEKEIAKALLKVHRNVKTVCKRVGAIKGEYRVRPLKIIAGEQRAETEYREHGCLYKLDLAKVFFTPRLATERGRVAEQVNKGETVVDMFAGVGPYSILIAKGGKAKKVYAVDVNEDAVKYLKENIEANHVGTVVEAVLGDAKKVCKSLKADRVIMNLPKFADKFLSIAIGMVSKGIIHYYCFASKDELEELVDTVKSHVEKQDKQFKLLKSHWVRQVGPGEWNLVLDFQVSSSR